MGDTLAGSILSVLQMGFDERNRPWWIAGGLLWGIIGMLIASSKGRSGWGCLLGCLLGPFGLLIAMLMPDDRR